MDLALEALTVDVSDVQGEGCMEPESQAIDGGAGDLVVQGCGRLEETPDCLDTENGGKAVRGLGTHERQGVPIAMENVRREAPDAAGANAHGRGGEPIDGCAVPEGVLEFGGGEHVWGCAVALGEQADLTDISLLGTFAFTTALKCGNPLLTQRGHELSPCRELTRSRLEKEDIVEGMDGQREGDSITAASAAYLNKGMQATR